VIVNNGQKRFVRSAFRLFSSQGIIRHKGDGVLEADALVFIPHFSLSDNLVWAIPKALARLPPKKGCACQQPGGHVSHGGLDGG